jgi:hypothetical protein
MRVIDLLFAPPLLDESDATRRRNVNACGKWIITIYTSSVLPNDEARGVLEQDARAQKKSGGTGLPRSTAPSNRIRQTDRTCL